MLNEEDYVDRWVENVKRAPAPFDEIIIVDGGSSDGTAKRLRGHGLTVVERLFQDDFADQRNFGAELCKTDWMIELDADEMMTFPLIGGLRDIVADAERAEMDCVGIGRINFHDGVMVAGPGYKGLDYQYRLHNRRCRWQGIVHEEVVGYRHRYELKILDGQFIVHDKESARHNERNNYYRGIAP